MHPRSSMTTEQRVSAVDLFESGFGYRAVSSRLDVKVRAVKALEERFKIWGRAALERKPTKQVYSFEFKMAVVQQVLEGDSTTADLAHMHKISSPTLLRRWVQLYREQGEEGLRLQPKGRPKSVPGTPSVEVSELEKLRRENERLAAENAYLKKVRALRNQAPR